MTRDKDLEDLLDIGYAHTNDLKLGDGLICAWCNGLQRGRAGIGSDPLCHPSCSCHPDCYSHVAFLRSQGDEV